MSPAVTASTRTRVEAPLAASIASCALLVIALCSVTVRPLVTAVGLPSFLVNSDALLTPIAAAAVWVAAVRQWAMLSRGRRALTLVMAVLALTVFISWLSNGPRSVASLALGMSMLLLLPCALYLAALATARPLSPLVRSTLMAMVLLQLGVGLTQYVALSVAQKAPFGADLVDGTTSHNFWPVFALPASLAIAITGRGKSRYLWPATVTLLAIYAEAKAALIVWLPVIAVVLVLDAVARQRGVHPRRWRPPAHSSGPGTDKGVQTGTSVGIVIMTIAVIVIGIWWTPSVQGTWRVFLGHSAELERFAAGDDGDAHGPTLREGIEQVGGALTSEPKSFLLGLGPANTTSHAAEVLAGGARNGVDLPKPGPLAIDLLTGNDDIKFRDAQSSLLGMWGDLGTLGVLAYVLASLTAVVVLARPRREGTGPLAPQKWMAPLVTGSLFAGGALLDWPEQAGVVLPVMLATFLVSSQAEETASPGGNLAGTVTSPDRPAESTASAHVAPDLEKRSTKTP